MSCMSLPSELEGTQPQPHFFVLFCAFPRICPKYSTLNGAARSSHNPMCCFCLESTRPQLYVQQNLHKFTASDALETHLEFLLSHVIRGSFERNMLYMLFFPSWLSTRRPWLVQVHYTGISMRKVKDHSEEFKIQTL